MYPTLFLKAIFGILLYGYVGGTGGWTIETIFVYWTLVGVGLSWLFHKIDHKSGAWIDFDPVSGSKNRQQTARTANVPSLTLGK